MIPGTPQRHDRYGSALLDTGGRLRKEKVMLNPRDAQQSERLKRVDLCRTSAELNFGRRNNLVTAFPRSTHPKLIPDLYAVAVVSILLIA